MPAELLVCHALNLKGLFKVHFDLAKWADLMFDKPEEEAFMVEVVPSVTGEPADFGAVLEILEADDTEVFVGVVLRIKPDDGKTA